MAESKSRNHFKLLPAHEVRQGDFIRFAGPVAERPYGVSATNVHVRTLVSEVTAIDEFPDGIRSVIFAFNTMAGSVAYRTTDESVLVRHPRPSES